MDTMKDLIELKEIWKIQKIMENKKMKILITGNLGYVGPSCRKLSNSKIEKS